MNMSLISFIFLLSLSFGKPAAALAAESTLPVYTQLIDATPANNGMRMYSLCQISQKKICRTVQLELPLDCDWECQDGLLSLQGTAIMKGHWMPGKTFKVEAGFDTWRRLAITNAVYRIGGPVESCRDTYCQGSWTVTDLRRNQAVGRITNLDFKATDDVNYQQDPQRAKASLQSAEGLLVTGKKQGRGFIVDQVFRQWTPSLICNPLTKLRLHIKPTWPTDEAFIVFQTEEEAWNYQDPAMSTIYWAVQKAEDESFVEYIWGLHDLWAERVRIRKDDCQIEVLAEH